eukprot:359131-Chlamydomonas_euryale.AAC.1
MGLGLGLGFRDGLGLGMGWVGFGDGVGWVGSGSGMGFSSGGQRAASVQPAEMGRLAREMGTGDGQAGAGDGHGRWAGWHGRWAREMGRLAPEMGTGDGRGACGREAQMHAAGRRRAAALALRVAVWHPRGADVACPSSPRPHAQLSIVCGESASDVKELLASDVGEPLLAARLPCAHDGSGRLLLPLEFGSAALPDVYGTDKNETFKCGGEKYSTFRLQAVAVRRDPLGRTVRLDGVAAVLSSAFCVKTQRALNDYRKPEYPHSTDQLTKLRYIGKETAEKLQ